MSKGKHYDNQFKLDAVNYYLDHPELSVDDRVAYLGVPRASIAKWVRQFKDEGTVGGPGSGNYATDKDKEIARLKRELRDSKAANEILKKAIRILGD